MGRNDGIIGGDAVLDTWGYFGDAFKFDGTDDYIEVGNDSSLNITEAITISAWVYTPDDPFTQYRIFGKADTSGWPQPMNYILKLNWHVVNFYLGDSSNPETGFVMVSGTTTMPSGS